MNTGNETMPLYIIGIIRIVTQFLNAHGNSEKIISQVSQFIVNRYIIIDRAIGLFIKAFAPDYPSSQLHD